MPRSDTLTWSDFGDHIFICRSKTSAHIFMIYDDLIMIYICIYHAKVRSSYTCINKWRRIRIYVNRLIGHVKQIMPRKHAKHLKIKDSITFEKIPQASFHIK